MYASDCVCVHVSPPPPYSRIPGDGRGEGVGGLAAVACLRATILSEPQARSQSLPAHAPTPAALFSDIGILWSSSFLFIDSISRLVAAPFAFARPPPATRRPPPTASSSAKGRLSRHLSVLSHSLFFITFVYVSFSFLVWVLLKLSMLMFFFLSRWYCSSCLFMLFVIFFHGITDVIVVFFLWDTKRKKR